MKAASGPSSLLPRSKCTRLLLNLIPLIKDLMVSLSPPKLFFRKSKTEKVGLLFRMEERTLADSYPKPP
jgi:hypothetical protein